MTTMMTAICIGVREDQIGHFTIVLRCLCATCANNRYMCLDVGEESTEVLSDTTAVAVTETIAVAAEVTIEKVSSKQ